MHDEDIVNSYLETLEIDCELNDEKIDAFINYFQRYKLSDNLLKNGKVAQIISEFAKSEYGRKKFSTEDIISFLIFNLLPHRIKEEVNITSLQSCRAIGNIAFDNDEARLIIMNVNGLEKLVELIKLLSIDETIESHELKVTCDDETIKDNLDTLNMNNLKSPLYHLKMCLGCIFNVLNDNEIISEKLVNLDLVEVLQSILAKAMDTSIIDLVLNIYDFLLDFDFSRPKIIEKNVVHIISDKIFHKSNSVVDHTFQILSNMVETDSEKMLLINGGIYLKLLKLIDMLKDLPPDKILQLAADFIVLLLNGDISMKYLFDNGVNKVALGWIESQNSILRISGAFALSNIARSDESCKELMQNNVVEIIQAALSQTKPNDNENIDLLHAYISVLRNLAVPGFIKHVLIKKNVIETLLPFVFGSSDVLIFKSIITIRLLVDKQNLTKTKLLNDEKFLKHLIYLIEKSDNNSIQCEAMRLLSYIIIQCNDNIILKQLYDNKSFDHMCEMLTSKHHVMIIEALQALDIFIQIIFNDIEEAKLKIYCENVTKIICDIPPENINFKLMAELLKSLKSNIQHEKIRYYFEEMNLKLQLESWTKILTNEEINKLCNVCLLDFQ